jgi:hypothetical protein
MDKNSSRGRAHSIASIVLRRFAEGGGLLDEVATDVTPEKLTKIKQALIDLADEHALYAQSYRDAGATDAPEWEDDGE